MPENFSAHLRSSSANYETWLAVFPRGEVPLLSPVSGVTQIGEEKCVEVYLLNLRAMTLGQRARLLAWLGQKSGKPIYQIEAEIESHGFAIRASDVIVTVDMRAVV